VTGRWFSSGSPVSSTNKTGRHDITEILLKEALNTIKQTNKQTLIIKYFLIAQMGFETEMRQVPEKYKKKR